MTKRSTLTIRHIDNPGAARGSEPICRACPLVERRDADRVRRRPAAGAGSCWSASRPGDKEDLTGKPFVGPAGQMLDRALGDSGIDRPKVYVTNAVKHFKFVPAGKIPSAPEADHGGNQGMPSLV